MREKGFLSTCRHRMEIMRRVKTAKIRVGATRFIAALILQNACMHAPKPTKCAMHGGGKFLFPHNIVFHFHFIHLQISATPEEIYEQERALALARRAGEEEREVVAPKMISFPPRARSHLRATRSAPRVKGEIDNW